MNRFECNLPATLCDKDYASVSILLIRLYVKQYITRTCLFYTITLVKYIYTCFSLTITLLWNCFCCVKLRDSFTTECGYYMATLKVNHRWRFQTAENFQNSDLCVETKILELPLSGKRYSRHIVFIQVLLHSDSKNILRKFDHSEVQPISTVFCRHYS